jgi:hypothetical protein
MPKRALKCPVCGKPLSQVEFDKALGLWEQKREHIQHLEVEQRKLVEQARREHEKLEAERGKLKQQARDFRAEQALLRKQNREDLEQQAKKAAMREEQIKQSLRRQMDKRVREGVELGIAQQKKEIRKQGAELRKTQNKMRQLETSLSLAATRYERANEEIKKLREQIEKGITPQIEGLLEEGKLLRRLGELFPQDRFEHPGKAGDIIQTVREHGREIGKIVYECKRVKHFDRKHIEQAKEARRTRNADFAVLVTNAFPSKKQYYFVETSVLVISPVSLEPITQTLRDSLARISMLRMSNEAKDRAVQQVYEYLSSNDYANRVNEVEAQLRDLGNELKSEIASHKRNWEKRYRLYRALYFDIGAIDLKLRGLARGLAAGKELKLLPAPQKSYIEIGGLNG